MKKYPILFLVLASLVPSLSGCGSDDEPNQGLKRKNGYLVYEQFMISVTGTDATIEKFNGNESTVYIPETIQDYVDGQPVTYTVKRIADNVFYERSNLQSVSIPKSVESIGDYAFGKTAITQVVLPTANVGKQVFEDTPLRSLTVGGNAKRVPDKFMYEHIGAHSLASLRTLTFSEGIEEIGVEAFNDCVNVKDIVLPNSLTTIKESAFQNVIALLNVTFGQNLKLIENHAFYGCSYLATCKFLGSNPPQIVGGSTLAYFPVHTVIYVPNASLQAYTNALSGIIAYNCTIQGY